MASSLGRVLIVDDDPRIVEMLSTVATDLGYTVRGAGSGAEALEVAPFYHPDVVLLDMRMPGMPGQQVLKHLHQMERDLPVIVVTANVDPEVERRALAQGAFDYVRKPLAVAALQRLLAAAIRHRS